MKPIFVLNRYSDSIRAERASYDEIRAVADGKSDERLVHVELGDDGIVTTPVTADELREIAGRLDAERATQLRALIDVAAQLPTKAKAIDGIHIGSIGVIQIYITDAPWAEAVVEAWAAERKIELVRDSPPRTGTFWYPDAELVVDGTAIVRMIWPRADINTDGAVEDEIVKVRAERQTAARELEAF